jgi:hypothetical protein
MSRTSCPKCGWEIENPDQACPGCRAGQPPKAPAGMPIKELIGGVFALALIIALGGGFLYLIFKAPAPPDSNKPPPPPRETVYNSVWDGSVYEVERYLKRNLRDPKSFEAIAWGEVHVEPPDSASPYKYSVWVRYRAKNALGGYVIERQLFHLSADGQVLAVVDLGQ